MKRIMYSKSVETRTDFVQEYFTASGLSELFYLVPKKFMADIASRLPAARLFAYEDIQKHNDLFNDASDQVLLVLDRPSRYKNITSNLFVRLSRIAAKYQHRILVDIVPFTVAVEFLYCPLAFLDRTILGYQHWYSFRENNMEIDEEGAVCRAHDTHLLAQKLAPHCYLDYANFLGNQVEVIPVPLQRQEKIEYQELRDKLFAENKTASPIVTTLADWTNIRETRYSALANLLSTIMGKTIIYTNLSGHNRRLIKRFKDIEVKSFYDTNGNEAQYDTVILFEIPIVKNYLFLDVIANVRPDCRIIIFQSDTTVDKYLYKKMHDEYSQINAFTRVLYEKVNP